MRVFASLSVLVLLSGMLLCWKKVQHSYEVAVYGTNHRLPHGNWLAPIFNFFSPVQYERGELTFHGLLKARKRLEDRGKLSELMDKCLITVVEALDHGTLSILENARLTLYCDGVLLEFVSGEGENEVAMFDYKGELFYRSKASSWGAYLIKVFLEENRRTQKRN